MRDERLILGVFAPNEVLDKRTVNHSESRTTLILDRCASP